MFTTALVLALALFCFLLIKSADLVLLSIKKISLQTKTGIFIISSLILAIGTSLPELTVGFTSAMAGKSNLVLGVVVGSNLANLSLVAGFAALVRGRVQVKRSYYKRDVIIALLASLAPLLLIVDGVLNRVDGLVLLAIYGSYAMSFFRKRYEEVAEEAVDESMLHKVFRKLHLNSAKTGKEYGKLLIGIAMLLVSADMVVRVSTLLAETVNIPIFIVGLFVLSIGTSLPELVFSLRSLDEKHPSIFFGNLLGSTIANSTLIVGVSATISPIHLRAVIDYATAAGFFILIFLSFWFFIRSKHTLSRWEAVTLILLYVAFVVVEII